MLAGPLTPPGSVANTLLLRRALGPRCVCCGWYPTCLSLPRNREKSNHLPTASSSSSLCLEIELRLRNKATSIIKRILRGGRSLSQLCQNNIQPTDVTLPYLRMDTSWATHALNPQPCRVSAFFCPPLLICPSLSFNMNQTLLYLFPFHPAVTSHLPFLPTLSPLPSSPPSPSFIPGFQFRSMHTFCLRLITSLMELLY